MMLETTKELTEQLATRKGVTMVSVLPHEEFKIMTGQEEIVLTGPAVILINQD